MLSLRYRPRTLTALRDDLRRIGLGAAFALRPRRLSALPVVAGAVMRSAIGLEKADACLATDDPRPRHRLGFVGICGPMTPDSLMRGFSRGLYPFSHVGGKKWWMHPQRMTLAPHEIVRDKDVRRMLRNKRFRVTFDAGFEAVMRACAAPRDGHVPLTWITEDIIDAYSALHAAGHAHSFEVWNAEDELVGGGFGIAVGTVFVIESQFTHQRNASKVGMITLMRHLSAWGFALADGKGHTNYLESMGFRATPHDDYMAVMRPGLAHVHHVGAWRVDDALDAAQDWGPGEPMRKLAEAGRETREAVGSAA